MENYRTGSLARYQNKFIEDNPHKVASEAWFDWNEGWNDANKVIMNRKSKNV